MNTPWTCGEGGERRMTAELLFILEDDSHPLQHTLNELKCSCSERMVHIKCVNKRYCRSKSSTSGCNIQGPFLAGNAYTIENYKRNFQSNYANHVFCSTGQHCGLYHTHLLPWDIQWDWIWSSQFQRWGLSTGGSTVSALYIPLTFTLTLTLQLLQWYDRDFTLKTCIYSQVHSYLDSTTIIVNLAI